MTGKHSVPAVTAVSAAEFTKYGRDMTNPDALLYSEGLSKNFKQTFISTRLINKCLQYITQLLVVCNFTLVSIVPS